jgi:small subunit ribosomal protein S7
VHGSELLQRFINRLMLDGKKVKAEHIVYTALDQAAKKVEAEPLEVFEKAIANIAPSVEVRPRRVGGQTYQHSGRTMVEKLAGEFVDAFNNTGNSVKKKEDTHRMADANKAFSHYRF